MTTPAALAQSPLLVRRERLLPLVVLSLAVHLALVGLAVYHRGPPQVDLGQKPIVARLVRLGQKRPEQWLPRKDEAPPPVAAAPEPAPVVAQPPTPAPAAPAAPVARPTRPAPPQPARATAARATSGRTDLLSSVLTKVKRDRALAEPVYGDPNGDPMGDASEAGEGDQYLALVERALRESYVLPSTLSDRDRVQLQATVVLYLDQDGRVIRFAFEKPSGNSAFDAALERAIRSARIPPPPAELRRRYRDDGLGVVYRP